MAEHYDCIIIGAGPAGLAAGLYTARDRLKTLVLEKFLPGGQISSTDRIENYPGIERIAGPGLIEQMQKQAVNFGAEIKTGCEAARLEKLANGDIAVYCDSEQYIARAVILALGSDYRKLGIPGEEQFRTAGTGVSYCGTCDAPFFRGRQVVAVGGGNTAAAIEGEGKVQSVKLKDVKTNQEESYPCDGVFIFVGMVPNTGFLKGFVELTDNGFIKCDCAYLRTNVPGVFVAGDCRIGAAMQLATAVGDGVTAAMMLKQYFRDPNWWNEPVSDLLQPGGW